MKVRANGFNTSMPDTWEDRTMTTLVGPPNEKGFSANVVVTREQITEWTSIEDYAQEQWTAIANELQNLEVLDEGSLTVNGAAAYQRTYQFEMEGQQLQQTQTYVLGQDSVFVLTGTATAEDFGNHTNEFQYVVDMFQLVGSND